MISDRAASLGERGVSPVVGTAILIGIAIVLATVIGAFVFGFTDQPPEKPNVEFAFSQDQVAIEGRNDRNANNRTTYEDVLEVEVTHDGGEAVSERSLSLRLRVESNNGTASGYLMGYNTTENGAGLPYVNLTESNWNALGDDSIGVGDSSRYEFFVTKELGKDEDAVIAGRSIENLWHGSHCAVSAFNDTRNNGGAINITGNPKISVGVSRDCPFGNTNATIHGGDIREGGRIAPGDTVRVIWSPRNSETEQALASWVVADPDE